MPTNHAILSASSSYRWLECPPSAKLCAELPDTSSDYAREGTDAHALCEHRLKALLGRETTDPTENLTYYNEEMERCAVEYATYVYEQVEKAKVGTVIGNLITMISSLAQIIKQRRKHDHK